MLTKAILLYAILSTAMAAGAGVQTPCIQKTDSTAICEYLSHFLRKVQQPFYLYHWRSNPELVSSTEVQSNPQKYGHKIVETDAPTFIPGLYVNERTKSSVYGGGLYAAIDPAATENFGGSDPDSWAVLVMRIPVGFQILDLRLPEPTLVESEREPLKQALLNVNCPALSGGSYLSKLMRMRSLPRTCANVLASFITSVHVDGFLYEYSTADFKVCQSGTNRQLALVFTSSTWLNMTGADARVYTSRTALDLEDRRIIESVIQYTYTVQSLGDKAGAILWNLAGKLLKERYTKDLATLKGAKSTAECDSYVECTIDFELDFTDSVTHFKMRTKDYYQLLLPSYPTHFAVNEAKGPDHLHWNDLIATETVKNPETWIQENIFECGNANFLASPP